MAEMNLKKNRTWSNTMGKKQHSIHTGYFEAHSQYPFYEKRKRYSRSSTNGPKPFASSRTHLSVFAKMLFLEYFDVFHEIYDSIANLAECVLRFTSIEQNRYHSMK